MFKGQIWNAGFTDRDIASRFPQFHQLLTPTYTKQRTTAVGSATKLRLRRTVNKYGVYRARDLIPNYGLEFTAAAFIKDLLDSLSGPLK
jgi:hypothetical protein